jgi:transposase
VVEFLARQPKCLVAMESCATAHDWGRAIARLGHAVKLIPPIYVKPFVKRQKNDAADAEAIAEAASRPTLRFVAVKSAAQQAQSMVFRTRELLVGQRAQTINALRGHLAEYGVIAPQGTIYLQRLAEAIADPTAALPEAVRAGTDRSGADRELRRKDQSFGARHPHPGQAGCGRQAADDHAGHWPDRRHGHPGLCPADGNL